MKLIKKVLRAMCIPNSDLDVDAYRQYIFSRDEIEATRSKLRYLKPALLVLLVFYQQCAKDPAVQGGDGKRTENEMSLPIPIGGA